MRIYLGCVLAMSLTAGCEEQSFDGDDDDDGGYTGGGTTGGGGGGSGSAEPDNCPGSSACSQFTPYGLAFVGAQPAGASYPNGFLNSVNNHILSGGTDDIRLDLYARDGSSAPLAIPYKATATDPLVVLASEGPTVHLSEATGLGTLRITDAVTGELFDTYNYAASDYARAVAVSPYESTTAVNGSSAQDFAFWVGDLDVAIALVDNSVPAHRLIDTSTVLAADGAAQTKWDTLHLTNAAVGVHTITITTSTQVVTTNARFVDHVDSVVRLPTGITGFSCFAAYSQGAFIAHAPWQFTVSGTAIGGQDQATNVGFTLGGNCMFANAGQPATATAGDVSISVVL